MPIFHPTKSPPPPRATAAASTATAAVTPHSNISFDHLRPSGRIGRDSGHWSSAAQLEPDKTAFWLKLPGDPSTPITPQPSPSTPPPAADEAAEQGQEAEAQHKEDIVLAVEIKPKGAVMPVGTLVPAPNRLKYRVPRFDAQQKFKAQDSQNWGAIDRPTGYHPMELYSGDARRTSATLKELLKTPQNKLRGWENGKMLFGAGSEGSGAKAANAEATAALGRAVEHAGLNTGGGYGGCVFETRRVVGVEGLLCMVFGIQSVPPLPFKAQRERSALRRHPNTRTRIKSYVCVAMCMCISVYPQ